MGELIAFRPRKRKRARQPAEGSGEIIDITERRHEQDLRSRYLETFERIRVIKGLAHDVVKSIDSDSLPPKRRVRSWGGTRNTDVGLPYIDKSVRQIRKERGDIYSELTTDPPAEGSTSRRHSQAKYRRTHRWLDRIRGGDNK